MKPIFVLSSFTFLLFLSCDKKEKQNTSNNTSSNQFAVISLPPDIAGPIIQIDSFPLKVGNQWTYSVQEEQYDDIGPTYLDTYSYTLKVVSDTLVNGIIFACITNNDNHFSSLPSTCFCSPNASYYYVNFSNGLYQLATLANTDSAYIMDSSGYIMLFPSGIGNSWTSIEHIAAADSVIQRNWISYVRVPTAIDTFNCIKMNINDAVSWNDMLGNSYQYFSSKGLIQEIQNFEGEETLPGAGPTITTRIITLASVNF